MRINWIKSKH